MERNTEYRENGLLVVPVAANFKCEAGNIAVISAGYAAPGSVANGLVYLGRFEETVDNTGGAAGDVEVTIRTGLSFKWKNSSTDPVVQADVGSVCYIEDAVTVSKTDNSGARSAAGMITGVDSGGVWVAKSI